GPRAARIRQATDPDGKGTACGAGRGPLPLGRRKLRAGVRAGVLPPPYDEFNTSTFRLAVAQFEEAADRLALDPRLRERLKLPQRALIVSVPIRMDDGSVKVYAGYRVQHDTAIGPSKGGVRFHLEVNL